jgi:hypothetical protein
LTAAVAAGPGTGVVTEGADVVGGIVAGIVDHRAEDLLTK